MTNEELLRQYRAGDATAFDTLYQQNIGLIQRLAVQCAGDFGYRRQGGRPSAFMDELIDELCAEGGQAFCVCVTGGGHDEAKGKLTTYLVPFLKGAMYRWLEKLTDCQTNIVSIYDLIPDDGKSDPFSYISERQQTASASDIVYLKVSLELLQDLFDQLSDKGKSILGHSFGVFGYEHLTLDDLALQELLTIDGVVKARKTALRHLQEIYPESGLELWRLVHRLIRNW